ncbi:MAG: heavy-metal-associated domain-containing protein [Planctomycetes bacterium]|nr:heavy-metal-associated domain-containing protein [Planctomycetota bacterium]
MIDTLDDATFHAYGEPRNATFIVDREHRVLFKGAWTPPSAVAGALRAALGRSAPTPIARDHENRTERQPTPETISISIEGMVCAGCELAIGNAVRRLPGVADLDVSFERAEVRVTFDPSLTSRSDIESAIRETGFGLPTGVEREKHEE